VRGGVVGGGGGVREAGGNGGGRSEQDETLGRMRAVCCRGSAANPRARPCVPLGGEEPPAACGVWWWGAARGKTMITVLAQPPVRHLTSTAKRETREKGNKLAIGARTLPAT